ncbi:MAG: O-antigen ligase family protein [Butyrivibrio sp.]
MINYRIRESRIPFLLLAFFCVLYSTMPDYFFVAGRAFVSFLPLLFVLVTMLFIHVNFPRKFMPMLFVVIIGAIPYMVHDDIFKAINNIVKYFMIPLLAYYILNSKEKVEKLEIIMAIVSFAICISGLVEYVFKFNVFSLIENTELGTFGSKPYIRMGKIRIEQAFNTANTYGIYLCIMLGISAHVFTFTKKRFYLINCFLLTINVLLCNSRMTILTFLIEAAVIFFIFDRKQKRQTLEVMGIMAAILCIYVIFINRTIVSSVLNTIKSMVGLLNSNVMSEIEYYGSNPEPFSYRLSLFGLYAGTIFKNAANFLVGIGENTSISVQWEGADVSSIDNQYIYAWVNNGILGLISMMMLFFTVLLYFIKVRKTTHNNGLKILEVTLLVYFINLLAVAQMADERIWIVMVCISSGYLRYRDEFLCKKNAEVLVFDDNCLVKQRLLGQVEA